MLNYSSMLDSLTRVGHGHF